MKKIAFILLSFSTLHAALPPLAQSSREIKEIMADPRLYQSLGGAESILQILKVDGGYEISTLHRTILVNVNYVPNQMIGPISFELDFCKHWEDAD